MTPKEVMKALAEGKWIRKSDWEKGYIYLDEHGYLVNNNYKHIFNLKFEEDDEYEINLLTDEERAYLKANVSVLKPLMIVTSICKIGNAIIIKTFDGNNLKLDISNLFLRFDRLEEYKSYTRKDLAL